MIWLYKESLYSLQLIGLYSFSSTFVFLHLLYVFKWNGFTNGVFNEFTEKMKIVTLTVLSIEYKSLVHLSFLWEHLFISYAFTVNRIKPLPDGGSFLLTEGEEFPFGLILSETTKVSRVMSCYFSALGLHDHRLMWSTIETVLC